MSFEKEMTNALMKSVRQKSEINSALNTLKNAVQHYEKTPATGEEAVADMFNYVRKAIQHLENAKE